MTPSTAAAATEEAVPATAATANETTNAEITKNTTTKPSTTKESSSSSITLPPPRHFVFGYGSLICEKSRSVTNPNLKSKEALPVVIQDVERVWSARTKTGYTAMGVRFAKDTECTGVLIEVNVPELADLDKREANYDRRPIQLDNIDQVPFLDEAEFYEDDHPVFDAKETEEKDSRSNDKNIRNKKPSHNVHVWIYIQRNPIPPDESHPIPQSYVDIIIRGALAINEEFAKSVIDTTHGWNAASDSIENNWVDDRDVPIYKRADSEYSNQHGQAIDQLLEEQHPVAYEERVEYDPMDHLEALAEALEDDLAHPMSIKHVVTQVKKEALRVKEEEEAAAVVEAAAAVEADA